MADEIIKATLQLNRWKRGKGKNDKLFNQLCHKEKCIIRLQSSALLHGAQKRVFGPSDVLLPLDTNHCRQQPMFCQVFPGRIMGQHMLPLALCEFLLSPSSLSSCGHRTKVWAFRHCSASRLLCVVTAPWPEPVVSRPSALLGLAGIPQPWSSASPVLHKRCWALASL